MSKIEVLYKMEEARQKDYDEGWAQGYRYAYAEMKHLNAPQTIDKEQDEQSDSTNHASGQPECTG